MDRKSAHSYGRFLQADPHIQAPKNSQNYNRYSYVLNNPMSYTDPSGYFFKKLGKFIKRYWKVAVAAVAAYYTFGWALNGLSSTVNWTMPGLAGTSTTLTATRATTGAYIGAGGAAGAVSGAILTGSLKGTLQGAFAGGITAGVAGHFGNQYTLGRVASDGLANGIASKVSGGHFKDGLKMGLAVTMATYVNVKLRSRRLKHSQGTPGQVGKSPGFRGISGKLGGGRIVDKYWAGSGQKILDNGGTIEEAMNAYYNVEGLEISPLGGHQGGQGIMFSEKFKYSPGSIFDYVTEGFAGTHDSLNSWYHYNPNGTAIARSGMGDYFGEVLNGANVLIATPIVAPSLIPDYMRHTIYTGVKEN